MRIFKPKFKNAVGELVESPNWHFEFEFAGQRVSESARTASKELAEKAMRKRHRELEEARALGAPLTREDQRDRVRRVSDFVAAYLVRFEQDHASRPNSITYERNRLKTIVRHLGTRIRGQLTDAVMRGYVTRRVDAGVSGSTINGELAALCRALGTPWKALWPKLPRREEREDVGRALEPEEITRLLAAIDAKPRRKWAGFVIRTLLQTGMRSGELLNARWRQVDFNHEVFTVGRAKTKAGTGRQIPLSGSLRDLFTNYRAMYEKRFGPARAEWFIVPAGKPQPHDVTRPCQSIESSWREIRKDAGVACRLHDCRHTAISIMGEAGVPDAVIKAIAGHVSQAMLERYSHARREAKRAAVEAMSLTKAVPKEVPIVARLAVVK